MQWIRHDTNARHDPRVLLLRARAGYEGYGQYWALIELMASNGGELDATGASDVLALEWGCTRKVAQERLDLMLEVGLLCLDEKAGVYYSKRLRREYEHAQEVSDKRRQAIEKRWKIKGAQGGKSVADPKVPTDTNEIQMNNTCNTNVVQANETPEYNCNTIRIDKIRIDKKRKDNITTLVHSANAPTHETCGKPVDKPVENSPKRNDYPKDFLEFWTAYPKRAGNNPKKPAFKRWQAATKRASPETIIAGARRYAEYLEVIGKLGTEFVQQARTWLDQDGWENEYETPVPDDKMSTLQRQLQEGEIVTVDCLGREIRWDE